MLINLSMFPKTTQKIAADKDRMLRVTGVTIYSMDSTCGMLKKEGKRRFRGNGSAVSGNSAAGPNPLGKKRRYVLVQIEY